MSIQHYDETDDLTSVFVGRRIVAVDQPAQPPHGGIANTWSGSPQRDLDGYGDLGMLTLDNGTRVYVQGHYGGCVCDAGNYALTKLATVDNVITSVHVVKPAVGSEWEYPSGTYAIFVVTAAEQLNVAEFDGSDGNGYYGTGFHLAVVPA